MNIPVYVLIIVITITFGLLLWLYSVHEELERVRRRHADRILSTHTFTNPNHALTAAQAERDKKRVAQLEKCLDDLVKLDPNLGDAFGRRTSERPGGYNEYSATPRINPEYVAKLTSIQANEQDLAILKSALAKLNRPHTF